MQSTNSMHFTTGIQVISKRNKTRKRRSAKLESFKRGRKGRKRKRESRSETRAYSIRYHNLL